MEQCERNNAKRLPIAAIDAEALRRADAHAVRRLLEIVAQWGRRQGLSGEDAEDVAAVAVQRACTSIGSFRGESDVAAWVLGIARHVQADLRRGRQNGSRISLDQVDVDPPSHEDVQELAFGQLVAEEALAELSEDERKAVCLTTFNSLSNQEAAETMGKTCDAFTCLRYRAFQKIARFFDENL